MSNQISKDYALLLLRLVFGGAMIIGHGWRKLNRIINGAEIKFSDPLGIGQELSFYLAVGAEFFCAVLLIIGLFTRLATIPLLFTMLVIIFLVQIDQPFGKMELPILYATAFIVILLLGPGKYSLDNWRFQRHP